MVEFDASPPNEPVNASVGLKLGELGGGGPSLTASWLCPGESTAVHGFVVSVKWNGVALAESTDTIIKDDENDLCAARCECSTGDAVYYPGHTQHICDSSQCHVTNDCPPSFIKDICEEESHCKFFPDTRSCRPIKLDECKTYPDRACLMNDDCTWAGARNCKWIVPASRQHSAILDAVNVESGVYTLAVRATNEGGESLATASGGSVRVCEAGKYQASLVACTACPQGKFSDSVGVSVCRPCADWGHKCTEGSPKPEVCPAGQYVDPSARHACHNCPRGKFALCNSNEKGGDCPPQADPRFNAEGVFRHAFINHCHSAAALIAPLTNHALTFNFFVAGRRRTTTQSNADTPDHTVLHLALAAASGVNAYLGAYITIGREKRTITAYDRETRRVTVAEGFSADPFNKEYRIGLLCFYM